MKSGEGVQLECSPEEAWQFHKTRMQNDADFSTYELPEKFPDDPSEIYELLCDTEERLFPQGNYREGSAKLEDELLIVGDINGVILTAEHASEHWRLRENGQRTALEGEEGTGALCAVVGKKTQSMALIAVGRQTADANNDAEHYFKNVIGDVISQSYSEAHISLHGMVRARAQIIDDKRGFAVVVGIGNDPSDKTRTFAEDYLVNIGKELDLRVGVNQELLLFNKQDQKPRLNKDGTLQTAIFKGSGNTTRAFSEQLARRIGKGDSFTAVQLELSDVLRYAPEGLHEFPNQRDREIGAYLGYLFVRLAAESVPRV